MIHEVIMYAITCDNCKEDLGAYSDYSAWADKSQVEDDAENSEWEVFNGTHYCPNCYTRDKDGNVAIKNKPKK